MCPNCRAFVTVNDKVCPYCDAPLASRAIDRRSPDPVFAGLIPSARFATSLLLLINFGLYAVSAAASRFGFNNIDAATLLDFGAKRYREIFGLDQWWRLVTAGFLHGNLLHLVMNSLALYDLGSQVEEEYGTARFLAIYFAATVTGFLASSFWNPFAPSVGASAGIFGLVGAMIAFGIQHRERFGPEVRRYYTRYALYSMLLGLILPIPIDNAAHLGGLVGGLVMTLLLGAPKLLTNWRDRVAQGAAGLSLMLTALSFFLMVQRLTSARLP